MLIRFINRLLDPVHHLATSKPQAESNTFMWAEQVDARRNHLRKTAAADAG
jgi:hypothetical protein